ncbi:MAG: ABC transporter substrate-binding protein [Chloroflexi bacterium]|nr:ABC transporter substrate-binding protein [Chloroflexota bacterium]
MPASASAPASASGASSSASASGGTPGSASGAASASGSPSAAASGPAVNINVPPLSPRAKFHIALPQGNTAYIAFYYALEKGYFDKAGLDVTADHFRGSVTQQMPRLATGDIDFLPAPASPALLNQQQQGFGVKIVAGMDVANPSKPINGYLMLQPELQGKINDYKDLKGHTIEGAVQGSPADVYARAAVVQGGLAPKDVTLKYDVRGDPSDMLNIAKNKVADVVDAPSPLWVDLQNQKLMVIWKSAEDTAPWFQTNALGFSSKAMSSNRAAVEKFLEVYLLTARELNKVSGWPDELVNIDVKYSYGDATPDQIRGTKSLITYEPNGQLSLDSLHRVQDMFVEEGLLKTKADEAQLIDNGPLNDALKAVGKV